VTHVELREYQSLFAYDTFFSGFGECVWGRPRSESMRWG